MSPPTLSLGQAPIRLWPSAHGDYCAPCGVSSRATICHRTRYRLSSLRPLAGWALPPPRVPTPTSISPVLPHVSGLMADFLIFTPLRGVLSCHHVFPDHGMLTYCHVPRRHAHVPSCAPGPVADFLISALLKSGLSCHHVPMDP
jgi:hypothetical protein